MNGNDLMTISDMSPYATVINIALLFLIIKSVQFLMHFHCKQFHCIIGCKGPTAHKIFSYEHYYDKRRLR